MVGTIRGTSEHDLTVDREARNQFDDRVSSRLRNLGYME